MKNNIKKIIFFLILFTLMSVPAFAGFENPEEPPGDGDPEPVAAPIDDYLWVLTLVGIGFGIYKVNGRASKLT
jgi:hypothetical protein